MNRMLIKVTRPVNYNVNFLLAWKYGQFWKTTTPFALLAAANRYSARRELVNFCPSS
jgi:hypothetical protein